MLYTPRARLQDERDAQREQVNSIVANMKTKFTPQPKVRTVWNECLQRHVEVR